MTVTSPDVRDRLRRFRAAYAAHRALEGRGAGGAAETQALPYLRHGPLARQWRVRARTFERFVARVLEARAKEVAPRPLRIGDLGAGNGWLCYRVALGSHRAVALDLRTDAVDGLAAAAAFRGRLAALFGRVAATFEALPVAGDTFDIAVFNAALHYTADLPAALREAARIVMPGGRIAILDSPFYRRAASGAAMVAEKHRTAARQFGILAEDLLGIPFIEYLTPARLRAASAALHLTWRRHRVRYPLWYELRPLSAALRRRRLPSRFDVWEAVVP